MMRPKVKHSGFTLIEVLIAVGAVSLIAIGLAKVFSSTGETVRAGRRISNFNEYASLIERQLRDDAARMSREGFLVIRNRNTANQTDTISVRLSPDQPAAFARPRRVDELMFFASGNFTTLRDPIHPSRTPAGSAARIYYGHGLRSDPADPPRIDEYSTPTPPQLSFGAANSANEFASGWVLLRHITSLVDPATSTQTALPPGITQPTANELPDNDIQVGLQPAAASIFRNLAIVGPNPVPPDTRLVRDGENVNTFPQFSSGIIDLATTNFSEMRQIILDAQPFTGVTIPWDPERDNAVDGAGNRYAYQRDGTPTAFNNVAASVTSNMKRWKIGALPAGFIDPLSLQPDRRMRCELTPPDLLGVITNGAPWPADEPWKRSDRMMLAASNFVPHCTEFIVEWSFGIVERNTGEDDYGQLKWYGLERYVDPTDTNSTIVAKPYSRPSAGDTEYTYFQRIVRRDGSVVGRSVSPALVHFPPIQTPPQADFPPQNAPLYSCFGYLDPTYPDPGMETDPQQRFPASIPWAWPKLLRITISLVDPSEPLREQTFQFVIELPEARTDRF